MSDPVTLAVAAAVAGKVGEGLVDGAKKLLPRLRKALRERFADSPEDTELLQAVQDDEDDTAAQESLAERLTWLRANDPEIRALIDQLAAPAPRTNIHQTVSGTVHGTVTQIGEVQGDITIGRG